MMKKTALIAALCLALGCGTALAADGYLVDRYQSIGEKFLDILDGGSIPSHAELHKLMDKKLQEAFTEADYARFRNEIADKYGVMKSARFVVFERQDEFDELMYRAEFTKISPALVHFGFDKNGRVQHFQVDLLVPRDSAPAGEAK